MLYLKVLTSLFKIVWMLIRYRKNCQNTITSPQVVCCQELSQDKGQMAFFFFFFSFCFLRNIRQSFLPLISISFHVFIWLSAMCQLLFQVLWRIQRCGTEYLSSRNLEPVWELKSLGGRLCDNQVQTKCASSKYMYVR